MSAEELAERFQVSLTTIHEWGREGLLRRHRYDNNVRCLYEPVPGIQILKGKGGRRPTPPQIITAPLSQQEAV